MATPDPSVDALAALGFMIAFFIGFLIVFAAIYVYSALALLAIAKKTKTKNEWMAWIPVANMVLMAKIAKMPWQPILLYIPYIFFAILSGVLQAVGSLSASLIFSLVGFVFALIAGIYMVIWNWKMYERVSRPGFWALLPTVLIILFFGIMLFGTSKETAGVTFIGVAGMVLSTLLQFVFLGIAAWHKDSVAKK